jgi:hypothetical protein
MRDGPAARDAAAGPDRATPAMLKRTPHADLPMSRRRMPRHLLLGEMARTLLQLKWFVLALMAALAFKAALNPSLSWLAKEGVAAVQAPSATITGIIAVIGLPFVLIICGSYVAEFAERIASKTTEQRLIILLQRIYLRRRDADRPARDVTQVLYGSELAKKGFEVIYKDLWRLTSMIGAILLWQLSISPGWVPILLLSIVPALLFAWTVGPRIQQASRHILALQKALAARTAIPRRGDFERSQERLFRSTILLEIFKWLADRGMSAILWLSFGACVGLSLFFDLGLLPDNRDIATASSLAVNLALLAVPVGEIGKVYTKWREAMPALQVVYQAP